MKAVLPKVKGRADGKLVTKLSENILAKTRKLDKRSSFFYISFLTGNFIYISFEQKNEMHYN